MKNISRNFLTTHPFYGYAACRVVVGWIKRSGSTLRSATYLWYNM